MVHLTIQQRQGFQFLGDLLLVLQDLFQDKVERFKDIELWISLSCDID